MESNKTNQKPLSLWDTTANEKNYQNSSTINQEKVEVAIVGGGFTGLSTALFTAQSGISAHVLEQEQIGFGGSGRNVGLVNAGVWLPPSKVISILGKTSGEQFLKTFSAAPQFVFDLIEKYQIQCNATRTGTIHAAHAPSGFKNLEERYTDWKQMGEPVELLSKEKVSQLVGTNAFYGGLLDNRAGTINPMGYCRGLARVAIDAGAKISTNTKVTKISKEQEYWLVETDQGILFAKHVVLATNAYTDSLWPNLKKIFTNIDFFQISTTPLGSISDNILPERQGVWDTGKIMFSLRKDNMNRLILGSMGATIGTKDQGLTQRWAKKQLNKLFPTLENIDFDYIWSGQIALTADHLPRVFQLDKNLFAAIGYNGRGITTGTIFGKAIADMIKSGSASSLPLPLTNLQTDLFATTKSSLFKIAFFANQLIKSI